MEGFTKVLFRQQGDDEELIVESMWCIPLGHHLFEIANIPFELYGIAFGDIVEAEWQESMYVYTHTVSVSGHSVLRVLHPAIFDQDAFTKTINTLGAWIESASNRLCAIDVPAEVSLNPILTYLQKQETAGHLVYEEGSLSEAHRKQLR